MQSLDHDVVMVNPATGLIDEQLDAAIDAADVAYKWGHEDATEGRRQDAFVFAGDRAAERAYHEGYKAGSIVAAILTGATRKYFDPANPLEIQMVSWNSEPILGDFRCPICGKHYDPTYGHTCKGGCMAVDEHYVPFQMPKEAYADVIMEPEDREEPDQFGAKCGRCGAILYEDGFCPRCRR